MNHDTDYLPTEVYNSHNQLSENRQGFSQLLDTRVCDIRPVPTEGFARYGFVGGQTLKVRRPDLGEIGLSDAEIEHAIVYGITM
jgi:hypothetical protein